MIWGVYLWRTYKTVKYNPYIVLIRRNHGNMFIVSALLNTTLNSHTTFISYSCILYGLYDTHLWLIATLKVFFFSDIFLWTCSCRVKSTNKLELNSKRSHYSFLRMLTNQIWWRSMYCIMFETCENLWCYWRPTGIIFAYSFERSSANKNLNADLFFNQNLRMTNKSHMTYIWCFSVTIWKVIV